MDSYEQRAASFQLIGAEFHNLRIGYIVDSYELRAASFQLINAEFHNLHTNHKSNLS